MIGSGSKEFEKEGRILNPNKLDLVHVVVLVCFCLRKSLESFGFAFQQRPQARPADALSYLEMCPVERGLMTWHDHVP